MDGVSMKTQHQQKESLASTTTEFDSLLGKPHISCGLSLQKEDKSAGILMSLLQRVNPIAIMARIRFDTNVGKWALLDDDNKPTQHFESGIMEDATMETVTVSEYVGCGSSTNKQIGIAKGKLKIHKLASSLVGAKNLKFSNGKFLDNNNQPIIKANKLALMPDRRAIYWE